MVGKNFSKRPKTRPNAVRAPQGIMCLRRGRAHTLQMRHPAPKRSKNYFWMHQMAPKSHPNSVPGPQRIMCPRRGRAHTLQMRQFTPNLAEIDPQRHSRKQIFAYGSKLGVSRKQIAAYGSYFMWPQHKRIFIIQITRYKRLHFVYFMWPVAPKWCPRTQKVVPSQHQQAMSIYT